MKINVGDKVIIVSARGGYETYIGKKFTVYSIRIRQNRRREYNIKKEFDDSWSRCNIKKPEEMTKKDWAKITAWKLTGDLSYVHDESKD